MLKGTLVVLTSQTLASNFAKELFRSFHSKTSLRNRVNFIDKLKQKTASA
jgi:hypothetical protein